MNPCNIWMANDPKGYMITPRKRSCWQNILICLLFVIHHYSPVKKGGIHTNFTIYTNPPFAFQVSFIYCVDSYCLVSTTNASQISWALFSGLNFDGFIKGLINAVVKRSRHRRMRQAINCHSSYFFIFLGLRLYWYCIPVVNNIVPEDADFISQNPTHFNLADKELLMAMTGWSDEHDYGWRAKSLWWQIYRNRVGYYCSLFYNWICSKGFRRKGVQRKQSSDPWIGGRFALSIFTVWALKA